MKEITTIKAIEIVGQPVTYTSGIPAQSSGTAFVSAVNVERERVDLLVLDESKKNLLNGMNWWHAFRRIPDVPHASEQSERHGFEFLRAVALPELEKSVDPAEPAGPVVSVDPIVPNPQSPQPQEPAGLTLVQPGAPATPEAAPVTEGKFNDYPSSDPETRAEEAQDEVEDAVAEQKAADAAQDVTHSRKKKKVSG